MKQKAAELVQKLIHSSHYGLTQYAKEGALVCVENEYNALRELLFNLRSCRVIESEKVYLHRLDELIKEEQEVKYEIEKS